jgi:PIN domain nuclease of toxin-antitoxin system
MKYLLDTHAVLWFAENSDKLSGKANKAIQDENSEVFVSIVSAWEVAIKLGTNKLKLQGGLPEFYRMIDRNGFITLPVEREYLLRLKDLPEHHKDPFDRMLIATAIVEDMTVITIDANIRRYDLPWLW